MRAEKAPAGPLDILYQDEYYVAVYKPANLFVHRTALSPEKDVLLQRLRNQIGRRIYPVHRLDRATAGVVVFGLSSEDSAALCRCFEQGEVEKSYLAVARGFISEPGVIDSPLRDDAGIERDAVTRYQPLSTVELPHAVGRYQSVRLTLVEVSPETGRRHQIRRHLSRAGHPIIGDSVHGDHRYNRFFLNYLHRRRLMLLSRSLSFIHPISGEVRSISAEPDDSFSGVLYELSLSL
ncbi:MAG: pseudouridine synthase [Acidobacteriota bacterium]|nr:pseudouridine synthase [Acidobacteriota bacterium]